ncbi:hypothetical protein CALCODRAFT_142853 [Calocera cornea HHB12733]|uniref:S-adenosyl-L-methionine-dependent methyltransferase n=1 Tax=Calocera cornea HHB12733 TaxID=1353952 RepID=A0A165I652_9BASI|nr:hypothetical protein CALCODRAFT_142853 [Calocera cornea HHB12733]
MGSQGWAPVLIHSTGVWLADVANLAPSTLVGVDISDRLFPPPKAHQSFLVHSSLQLPVNWSSRFSLVHQRLMGLAFGADAWKTCIGEYIRALKPGGWVMLEEMDVVFSFGSDFEIPPVSARSISALRSLCATRNIDPDIFPKLADMLTAAGFVDVHVKHLKLPVVDGDNDGLLRTSLDAWRGMKAAVLTLGGLGLGKDEEEFDAYLAAKDAEWRNGNFCLPWIIWTARKPL